MEEKKKTKEVKMIPETDMAKREKLSYEQLENVAHQLSQQNREMYQKLQQFENQAFYKRLDYLFMVIQSDFIFEDEFVQECAQEIKSAIKIPENSQDETVKENN
jgi:hypothetical protein